MKDKKSGLYFYELLRDFLYKYLVIQRKFSPATVKNYTDSLDQYRIYLRDQKGIPFDKVGFHCFQKDLIYDFCIWLRDNESKAINTINLRLAAIKAFLRYCSEEDAALSALYLKAKSIHQFKGKTDPKLEYLNQNQLETVFAAPSSTETSISQPRSMDSKISRNTSVFFQNPQRPECGCVIFCIRRDIRKSPFPLFP